MSRCDNCSQNHLQASKQQNGVVRTSDSNDESKPVTSKGSHKFTLHDETYRTLLHSAQEINSVMIQRTILANLDDGWISRTLVVRPKPMTIESFRDLPSRWATNACRRRPLVIYFHGGGFAAGSPTQLSLAARCFAEHLDATVVLPSYRLVPEHPWPQSMKDAMEIVQLISCNKIYHYGAYPDHGLILAGCSAGACLAAVVAGLTSSDPLEYPLCHRLTGLFLSIAVLLVESIVPPQYKHLWTSHQDNSDTSCIDSIVVDAFLTKLKDEDFQSLWFSPVNHFSGIFNPSASKHQDQNFASFVRNHPATYLQAGNLDRLRDDTLIYEKLLSSAGIRTKLHVFPNDTHQALTTLNLITPTKSRNPNIEDSTLEGIKWLCQVGLEVSARGNPSLSEVDELP